MIHQELLEKINYNLDKEIWFQDMGYALRAAVELHIPETKTLSDGDVILCRSCGAKATNTSIKDRVYYPCPTIQAINKELR